MNSIAKPIVKILQFLIPLGLGILCFLYVYKDLDFETAIASLKEVNYYWILLSMLVSVFGFMLRAFRWKLLYEPLGFSISFLNVSVALFIGFFANLLFPRLGEITRCGFLKKSNNVPLSESIGTVISERVIDLISFGILTILTLIVEWEVFYEVALSLADKIDTEAITGKIYLAIGGLLFLSICIYLIFKLNFFEKLKVFIEGVLKGLLSILKLKRRNEFVLSTIGIWVIYYLMLYLIFFALEGTKDLPPAAGLSVLVAGTLGMIVPVQSGIGTYHFFVSAILIYYGVTGSENEILPLVSHGSQTVVVLCFGLLSLLASVFILRKNEKNSG